MADSRSAGSSSYVVTGGGRGIGRAIAARLVADGDAVVVIELEDPEPQAGVEVVVGSPADEAVAERAADRAEGRGPLAGRVNNAAVFRDADLAADRPRCWRRSRPISRPRWWARRSPYAASLQPIGPDRSSTCRPTRPSAPCGGASARGERLPRGGRVDAD